QLKKTGTVKRGQLGIIIQEVSYDLATAFGLDRPRGALVTKIMPDSPAIKTDLKAGDIILAVNGEVVEVSSDLPLIIGPTPPNSVVKLTVWRKGNSFEVETTVSELGASATQATEKPQRGYAVPNDQSSFTLPEIGLTLAPLDKVSATRYQLENGGLMVVKAEKLAKKSGLQHGDVIVSVGQNPVSDEATFKNAIAGYNNIAPLYIMRGKQSLYLPLMLK
ncbi:MAG: PDZ domain-containing protein, partial [Neisseriaceae bacterium]|nr:PDZ domain-containing protein [Neisseriaceae bacterium]